MIRRYFSRYLKSTNRFAQFLRFATVGMQVSLIDIGGLYFLTLIVGLDFYTARVISLSMALFAGYLLNRYFTFKGPRRGDFFSQLFRHCGVHLIGSALNIGVYSYIITHGHDFSEKAFPLLPLLGTIIGGVVGMSFNFFFSSKLVFPKKKQQPAMEESLEAQCLTSAQSESPS